VFTARYGLSPYITQIRFVSKGFIQPSLSEEIKPLTPNDDYNGRTAPLTSERYILYIYSTNVCTEYFKHGINSPFFPLQNAVIFINLIYLVPVLIIFIYRMF